jgi:hypothetical protein
MAKWLVGSSQIFSSLIFGVAGAKLSRRRRIITSWAAEDTPLIITGSIGSRTWRVVDDRGLSDVLGWRDFLGGAIFFLEPDDADYPLLCMRVSGNVADIIFYPTDGHPGFRCLGGEGLLEGGMTTLVYEGCDPADGEAEPNRFIVPFAKACSVASDFLHELRMSEAESWLDLEGRDP